jgi:hypothetical protein
VTEVAFLVLAHRGPAQLARLSRRLLDGPSAVFVHVDRRAPDAVLAPLPRAVHVLDRIATPWSGWGPVEATLHGLAVVLRECDAGHVVLMSGQDYPLRPASEIAGFLADYEGRSFVARWPMPSPLYGPGGGMFRLRYRHVPFGRRRIRLPLPRRYPRGVRPYGGSAFMVLDRDSAAAVLDFTHRRPDVARFHRHVWAVDEHYVQTALANSPRDDRAIDENLWHIEWPRDGDRSPRTFVRTDFARLEAAAQRSSEAGGRARAKLFARKFDDGVDPDVLDLIDARLLHA